MKRTILAAVLLAGTALISPASADITSNLAVFTSDHCTDGCGPQPTGFATIQAVDHQNGSITITITPLNGNGIVNTGLDSFAFNLTGNQTITYSGLPSGFTVVNGTGTGNLTQAAGSLHEDGLGVFEYAINAGGNGANNPFTGPLIFTISDGPSLTLASFAELSTIPPGDTPSFFGLDIISKTTGNTGLVDCCVGQPTPFSAVPGPIAGAGIPGLIAACCSLFGFNRLRRRRQMA